jgi:hypothetical protein
LDLLKTNKPKATDKQDVKGSKKFKQLLEFILTEKKLLNIYKEYCKVKKAKEAVKARHNNPIAHIISVGMGKR